MNKLQTVLDAVMCLLWITTYVIAYFATKKYRHPSVPLMCQFFFISHEIAILFNFIVSHTVFNYAFSAYIVWLVVELRIILFVFGKCETKIKAVPYFAGVLALSVLTFFLLRLQSGMLFVTYGYTTIGQIIWLACIFDKRYPMKKLNLFCFITKFLADLSAIFVYFPSEITAIKAISVILPSVDLAFIVIFIIKNLIKPKNKNKNEKKKTKRVRA